MNINEINKKEVWENFLLECQEKTFLSSWNWGEFQKKENNKIWRLGIYSNEQLVGAALVIKIKAKRGTFLFVPHGPAFAKAMAGKPDIKYETLKILLEKLKEIAKEEKASFIRVAPICERSGENIKDFKAFKFKDAPIHMHPESTWEMDITLPEDALLMAMRKTTRYLIRQARKNNDIEIIQSFDIKDLEKFNKIYQETVSRHHFTPFSGNYLENQFSSFLPDNQISLFLGKYKNEIISSAIVVFWQNMGFYHHGASLSKYKNVPVSYLLQWEAIKEAKRKGCQIYNFWGIANEKSKIKNQKSKINKKHPWWGLTLFKMGFGGYKKEYVRTQDLLLSSRYYLTYIFEKLRRIKRGL